jgi:hypothetical protein
MRALLQEPRRRPDRTYPGVPDEHPAPPTTAERKFHGSQGRRPYDHPGLSALGL